MTYNTFNVSSARRCERPGEGRSISTWSVSLREQPASPGTVKKNKQKKQIKICSKVTFTASPQTLQSSPEVKDLFTQIMAWDWTVFTVHSCLFQMFVLRKPHNSDVWPAL